MNHFTRERYLALQVSRDEAMDAADASWAEAVDQYESHLQTIRPEMPESVRELLDGFSLHDARVLSMGQRGDVFVISLQLDVPPNELLTISYHLAASPQIKQELFPWVDADAAPAWLSDEIELIHEAGPRQFVHSILFSNGWEMRLRFRDVQLSTAFPTFPHPRGAKPVGHATAPQSA